MLKIETEKKNGKIRSHKENIFRLANCILQYD